jgi:hypothetical protein
MIFLENGAHPTGQARGHAFPDHALSAAERICVPDDYPAMKEHRLKRPALVMELLLALAASLVAGMFAWYAVLIWRFFFD